MLKDLVADLNVRGTMMSMPILTMPQPGINIIIL